MSLRMMLRAATATLAAATLACSLAPPPPRPRPGTACPPSASPGFDLRDVAGQYVTVNGDETIGSTVAAARRTTTR